jgi:hypothetical protein
MAKTPRRRELPEEEYTVTVRRDAETGIVVSEYWQMDGSDHREGAPSLIIRDGLTGMVLQEGWFHNGKLHRDDGPAEILRKAETGHVYYSAWYKDGVKIKPPTSAKRPTASPRLPAPKPR